ncbi:phosphotyrosine protein phosphatase [Psychroserpens sp.]|uniref:phosphotyrosine protein phosphatase n=1 Tax=Psychroserpens sp. TaxID=2020870 RepID=UPI002B274040|nr:phosphotyrosine protein phosphatase [Psychroserpens sp.]
MNILFVCSANKQRSKTAEDYFSSKNLNHNFHSVGTNQKICNKEGTNFITENDLVWADLVYTMEEKHRKIINKHSNRIFNSKIKVLHIPDIYKYYQKELLELLDCKVSI